MPKHIVSHEQQAQSGHQGCGNSAVNVRREQNGLQRGQVSP